MRRIGKNVVFNFKTILEKRNVRNVKEIKSKCLKNDQSSKTIKSPSANFHVIEQDIYEFPDHLNLSNHTVTTSEANTIYYNKKNQLTYEDYQKCDQTPTLNSIAFADTEADPSNLDGFNFQTLTFNYNNGNKEKNSFLNHQSFLKHSNYVNKEDLQQNDSQSLAQFISSEVSTNPIFPKDSFFQCETSDQLSSFPNEGCGDSQSLAQFISSEVSTNPIFPKNSFFQCETSDQLSSFPNKDYGALINFSSLVVPVSITSEPNHEESNLTLLQNHQVTITENQSPCLGNEHLENNAFQSEEKIESTIYANTHSTNRPSSALFNIQETYPDSEDERNTFNRDKSSSDEIENDSDLEGEEEKHSVKGSCNEKCKLKCSTKISLFQLEKINEKYYSLGEEGRKSFLTANLNRKEVSRRTSLKENSTYIRNSTFEYHLSDSNGSDVVVCKKFFTFTLGMNYNRNFYKIKNQEDPITHNVSPKNKRSTLSKCDAKTEAIKQHIENFNPCISHYRRIHAPNRRYLPSELDVTLLHKYFIESHAEYKNCKYEAFRRVFSSMNISFAKLGNEECELCTIFSLHEHSKENLSADCDTCLKFQSHQEAFIAARELYQQHKKEAQTSAQEEIFFTVDLQKVIMLPRMESFKTVMFTKRIIAFNESFVPIGSDCKNKTFAVLWHEAISGRKKENIISTYYHFLLYYRDKNKINLWLDNCSAQNKNWSLVSFFIYMINSDLISASSIELFFFESGHTYMAADSFHHQVEQSMKKMKCVYDFNDFIQCVEDVGPQVKTKVMLPEDFKLWKDCTSEQKIKKSESNRPNLSDMKHMKFQRNCHQFFYKKNISDGSFAKLDILKKACLKKMPDPESQKDYRGIPETKKESILKKLAPLMPATRTHFWKNIRCNNSVNDLITHED